MKNKTYHKKKILVVFTCAFLILTGLIGRLVYLMVFDAEYYQKRAEDLHKRERKIKAARPSCQRFYLFCGNKVEVTVDSVLQGGSGYCKFEGGTLVGFCQQAVDDTT